MPSTTVLVVLDKTPCLALFFARLASSLLCDTAHLSADTFSRGMRTDMEALEAGYGGDTSGYHLHQCFMV